MSFSLDLRKFAEKAKGRNNAVVRKIIMEVGVRVVEKSPVGDPKYWIFNRGSKDNPDYVNFEAYRNAPEGYVGGRFRANWQYGLNAPNKTTTENVDPQGAATIASIVGSIGDQPAGEVHYITNSLPYGDRLENGWSRQAPNGMVRLTVLEYQPIVDAAVRAVK